MDPFFIFPYEVYDLIKIEFFIVCVFSSENHDDQRDIESTYNGTDFSYFDKGEVQPDQKHFLF